MTRPERKKIILDSYRFHNGGAVICLLITVGLLIWVIRALLGRITSVETTGVGIVTVASFAGIIGAPGIWHFYRSWELRQRRDTLLQSGIRNRTKFHRLSRRGRRGGSPVNHVRAYLETSSAQFPDIVFVSDPFWLPRDLDDDFFSGREIEVYSDPNDPARYWMDLRFAAAD